MAATSPKGKTSVVTWVVAVLLAVFVLPLILGDHVRDREPPSPEKQAAANAQKAAAAMRDQDELWVANVQIRVRDSLKDRSSAEFRNARTYRGSGAPVVCGEVNAKNSFGGYGGFQRFVGAADVIALEEATGAGEMQRLWEKVCL